MCGYDSWSKFESSVISYGSQTEIQIRLQGIKFESSVISYGSQTPLSGDTYVVWFESSVISYGSQTEAKSFLLSS